MFISFKKFETNFYVVNDVTYKHANFQYKILYIVG
jgi:hypothetical protein